MTNLSTYAAHVKSHQKSSAELVTEALRQAIVDGVIAGGEAIRQAELARTFGVSRIPVREALLKLQSEGLVQLYANSVARVTQLSVADVHEIYDLRIALETLALTKAIEQKASFEGAALVLAEVEQVNDHNQMGALNKAFHLALYAPAKSPRLSAMIEQLHLHIDRYLQLAYTVLAYGDQSKLKHEQLLQLSQRGRTDEAEQVLERHLNTVRDKIVTHLG